MCRFVDFFSSSPCVSQKVKKDTSTIFYSYLGKTVWVNLARSSGEMSEIS